MVQTKARRGRPIGTGIDDSDRIARLEELLRTQPDLKPTTAIRVMGFTDPSTIRRLRDKFKLQSRPQGSNTALLMTGNAPRASRPVDVAVIADTPQLMR